MKSSTQWICNFSNKIGTEEENLDICIDKSNIIASVKEITKRSEKEIAITLLILNLTKKETNGLIKMAMMDANNRGRIIN